MAEDNDNNKTEHPSQKRLAPTRERGDVVKSHKVSDSLMLAGAGPLMDFCAAASGGYFHTSMRGPIAHAIAHASDLRSDAGLTAVMRLLIGVLAMAFLLLTPTALAGDPVRHPLVGGSADAGTAEGPAAPSRRTSVLKPGAVDFRKEIASIAVIGSGPGVEE